MAFVRYAALRPRTKSTNRRPRSTFRPDEDFRLKELVRRLGPDWNEISRQMGSRNSRQCKERWSNYLSPEISAQPWTEEEDQLLLRKVGELGPKWVQMTAFFQKRTDSNLKNRWFVLMRRARKATQQKTDLELSWPGHASEAMEYPTFDFAHLLEPTLLEGPMVDKPQDWDPLALL